MKILLSALVLLAAPLAASLAAGAASAQDAVAATLPNSFDQSAPAAAPAAPASDPAQAAAAEAALRAQIAAFQAGAPAYDAMTPGLAEAMREQAATLTPLIQSLGALQSVDHIGAENGAELFMATFETAVTQWIIGLDAQGKIGAMLFRPAEDAAAAE